MKNAFVKDCLRHVKGTAGRFIAIMAITALGVAFFAGIRATGPDMRATGQRYFSSAAFMDFSLLSTAGFTAQDVAAVRSVRGVAAVMPGYSADLLVRSGGTEYTVKLLSVDTAALKAKSASALNRPQLIAGRLPENEWECLADPRFLKHAGKKIGDTVTFYTGTGGTPSATLKSASCTIVGEAEEPLYISYDRGTSSIGSGNVDAYFLLPVSAFRFSAYTDLYVRVGNPAGLSRFDDAYGDLMQPVKTALGALGKQRVKIRYAQIRADALRQLADAGAKLADGEKQLADAKAKLDDAQRQIDAQQAKLRQAKQTLTDRTAASQRQLDEGLAALQAGQAQTDDKARALASAQADYDAGVSRLEAEKKQAGLAGGSAEQMQTSAELLASQLTLLEPGSAAYQTLAAQLEGLRQLIGAQQTLDQQGRTLASAHSSLAAAQQELAATRAQLSQAQSKLDQAREKGEAQLAAGQAQLAAAKRQLAAGRADYDRQSAQAQPKLDEARRSISDGQAQLDALKTPTWYVQDVDSNAGFSGFQQDAQRIDAIGVVFPLIFFLVAALVSLTTMTRLVENDRTYIGTMKALGYSKAVISLKYLTYAVSASLVGSVIGLFVGYNLFPRVIFDAYLILYTLPDVEIQFNIPYALISTACAVACAAVPAFLVCAQSLTEEPASLMRPKSPPSGKRILLERFPPVWKRLNFSRKVTLRNLFLYKKRFLMTVIGVAGCTALIFTGFGLRDSISTIVSKQYSDIRRYDLQVYLKDDLSAKDLGTLAKDLNSLRSGSNARIRDSLYLRQQSVDAVYAGKTRSAYLVVPQDAARISGYIRLCARVSGTTLPLDDRSVVVTEKFAYLCGYKAGDMIKLRNADGVEKQVRISGIAENYIYHYIFMSPKLYVSLYGAQPVCNQVLCRVSGSQSGAAEAVTKLDHVGYVLQTSYLKDNFGKMINALRYVVLVLISSAAALAFVVLFSLTSINIDERNREIATIKVLGFYDGETAMYIYRESILLTVIGAAVGLLLGVFMERFVITTSEVDLVMFSRDLLPASYVYSALLTFFFAFAVNAVMFRRLRKIDMVASLKSAE